MHTTHYSRRICSSSISSRCTSTHVIWFDWSADLSVCLCLTWEGSAKVHSRVMRKPFWPGFHSHRHHYHKHLFCGVVRLLPERPGEAVAMWKSRRLCLGSEWVYMYSSGRAKERGTQSYLLVCESCSHYSYYPLSSHRLRPTDQLWLWSVATLSPTSTDTSLTLSSSKPSRSLFDIWFVPLSLSVTRSL